jgi:hypothetical protein
MHDENTIWTKLMKSIKNWVYPVARELTWGIYFKFHPFSMIKTSDFLKEFTRLSNVFEDKLFWN